MEKVKYRVLLYLLRFLVYLKRVLFWFFKGIGRLFFIVATFFRTKIGFYLYKFGFKIKKKIWVEDLPLKSKVWDLFGRRGVLQVIFFGIALLVIYPQSRWYSYNTTKIPGRGTVFFKLVGPGDQDFSLDEIDTTYIPSITSSSTVSWNEGALTAQGTTNSGATYLTETDISGLAMGGGAVLKPSVLPGVNLGTIGAAVASERKEIIVHKVQTGETIGNLAQRYGISVATILATNNLTERSYIRPGDNLKILPVSGVLHVVKKGDTLNKIANLYKAKAADIISFNGLKENGTDMVVGQELIIPGGIKVAMASATTKPTTKTNNPTSQYYGLDTEPGADAANASGVKYLWPTGVRRITQYFGLRHTGVDIAGPIGTPIYATRDGVVIKSQCGWNGGYGCYIIIDHGGGIQSLYGHNSRLYVGVGDQVVQGQNIALMGSTGHSTGPHSHFEIRVNGARVNPLKYIK